MKQRKAYRHGYSFKVKLGLRIQRIRKEDQECFELLAMLMRFENVKLRLRSKKMVCELDAPKVDPIAALNYGGFRRST